MDDEFLKLCYEGFKKNDEKFPNWTLEYYKKYMEECDRILANENLIIIRKYEEDVKIEE